MVLLIIQLSYWWPVRINIPLKQFNKIHLITMCQHLYFFHAKYTKSTHKSHYRMRLFTIANANLHEALTLMMHHWLQLLEWNGNDCYFNEILPHYSHKLYLTAQHQQQFMIFHCPNWNILYNKHQINWLNYNILLDYLMKFCTIWI